MTPDSLGRLCLRRKLPELAYLRLQVVAEGNQSRHSLLSNSQPRYEGNCYAGRSQGCPYDIVCRSPSNPLCAPAQRFSEGGTPRQKSSSFDDSGGSHRHEGDGIEGYFGAFVEEVIDRTFAHLAYLGVSHLRQLIIGDVCAKDAIGSIVDFGRSGDYDARVSFEGLFDISHGFGRFELEEFVYRPILILDPKVPPRLCRGFGEKGGLAGLQLELSNTLSGVEPVAH